MADSIYNDHILDKNTENNTQYLSFKLGNLLLGVDIKNILEVKSYEVPIELPETRPYIQGVLDLRGMMVPIMDMREKLNLETIAYNKFNVIVIIYLNAKVTSEDDNVLGIIVDGVSDICNSSANENKDIPETAMYSDKDYISNIIIHDDKQILVINPQKLSE